MPLYTAVLDACVLVPITLADTLLRVAECEIYRPVWSARILGEVHDAVLEVHPDGSADRVWHRLADMDEWFEDACVTGWEDLESGITLPDPGDRHVVAAAVRAGAQAIVTANLRDFPAAVLEPLGLLAVHPDQFLLDQLDLEPGLVVDVLRQQAADTRNPPLTTQQVLDRLATEVPDFVAAVAALVPPRTRPPARRQEIRTWARRHWSAP